MARQFSTMDWNKFAVESRYRTSKLVTLVGLSRRQLERIVQRDHGCTPRSWLMSRRLIEAGDLLLAEGNVNKVSSRLLYKQASHFCRQFKEFYGVTPSAFIAAKQKARDVAFR